jgi:hypothetical protein
MLFLSYQEIRSIDPHIVEQKIKMYKNANIV